MWTSLIGFMGSGKSCLAASLGERAILPVVDLDAAIAGRTGSSIGAYFAEAGEAAFRSRETETLAGLPADDELVVACGGGVIERAESVRLLRERGLVVWLDLSWESVRRRLADDAAAGADRPLVETLGWPGLAALYSRRRPLYAAAADFRLRGDLGGPEVLARRVLTFRLTWSRQRRRTPA
jgi:shikimate kinase